MHGDVLRRQHLVVKRVHAGGRLVDLAREGDRSLEDGLETLLVLDARPRVLVFDDERGVRDVEFQELARGDLVIQPIDGAVLQVAERIVLRRTGELVCFFQAFTWSAGFGDGLPFFQSPRSTVWPP